MQYWESLKLVNCRDLTWTVLNWLINKGKLRNSLVAMKVWHCVRYSTNWPNYQSFWHNRHGLAKQEGVWGPQGACHHSPCPGVPLGLNMKSFKIPAYQNNNSEECPGQPAVRHFLYNPPNIINRFLLNFTIWRYFIKIFWMDTILQWFCITARPLRGFFVRFWFSCWLSWAIVNPLNSVGGHRRVTSIQFSSNSFWDDSLSKSETLPLCQNTVAFLLPDTTHFELEIQFE